MRPLLLSLLVLALACGDDDAPTDGGPDAETCTTDADCDDGVFCNGAEACVESRCVSRLACEDGESCDEASQTCRAVCVDADGDGSRDVACGGRDCDDDDPERFPGNLEVCDVDGFDEDCDPRTFGVRDLDSDGVPDQACCNGDVCGSDCDDARAGVNPLVPEVCNGIDDDCDGATDEGVLVTYWVDADRDGYGSDAADAEMRIACVRPEGFADRNDDCDDTTGGVNPGAVEVCDAEMRDEDCSGEADDVPGGCDCADGESRDCMLPGRCAGARQTCSAGRYGACTPGPVDETCNGMDDDCNGVIDDGLTVTCYLDADNDTYALFGAAPTEQCPGPERGEAGTCPIGFTVRPPSDPATSDCDDSAMMETLPEACFVDADADGFGVGAVMYRCACDEGFAPAGGDCCDADANAYPCPETPEGTPPCLPYYGTPNGCGSFDYDCDGVDEAEYPVRASCFESAGRCFLTNPGWVGFTMPECGQTTNLALFDCVRDGSGRCVPQEQGGHRYSCQ